MAEKLIAGGAWVQVQVKVDGELRALGLAQGCSFDEDWNIQQAGVLNHLGPISLDSQGYTCSITLSAFVPEAKNTLYADGGEITIEDLLPYRDDVQLDGKGRNFDQLAFVNTATQKVIRSFTGVVVASNGEQVSPNAYVIENIRFLALKRDKIS
ncbi:MAG: hypothetical protein DRJ31_10540 [Candidatus Methanomethylicota archaeon]|uniref:Uncharacterized protein n=1 Tax=Thermoproteota archaeon TaxID=2056631 RepID=A0A497ELJ3_9CREN|nr:MAG: hypothetical protein DRJ31_10540 [Candidatus Verstraetearchaeota archaeon]